MPTSLVPAKIQISVSSVEGFIDAHGSPVIQPHIHPDAAAWILEEAKENPCKSGYHIEIGVPAQDLSKKDEVASAIHAYFQV